ncbi:MAG: glycosyltransferase family 4 protein [Ruminococcaceae bacterium]|nr:glycosyltransferase family 4 protein [Oscillospiraceae bacterium]
MNFFNLLAKQCKLTVLYEKSRSDERDAKWTSNIDSDYETVFLKGKSTAADKAISFGFLPFIKRNKYDYIIICGVSSPTEILAITWCKLNKIPYCIEGDGAFPSNGRGFKESLKRFLIKDAALCFSTCKMHDEYYLQYGAKAENIVRYPFSSLLKKDVLSEPISLPEKNEIRKELNITEDKVIISVGQFIHRKGFDVLLKAASQISDMYGVYIVGGVPTDEYLSEKERLNLKNVNFIGFKEKNDLMKYFKAADVFLLPTREDIWGLVINEAMANGLPVITTRRCNAGLELISDGVNGYLVDVGDEKGLAEAINKVLDVVDDSMQKASLSVIENYTIESMVERHMEIFKEYVK